MEILIKNGKEVRIKGWTKRFSKCEKCGKFSLTVIRIVNGKKQSVCNLEGCEGSKPEPRPEELNLC